MLVTLFVAMVSLNHRVEESSKLGVSLVGTRVATNARVSILAAGKDALAESDTTIILLILKLIPDLRSEVLAEERFGAFRESGEAFDVLRSLKMGSTLSRLFSLGLFDFLNSRKRDRAEFFFGINHSLNTVVHVLYKLDLG